MKIAILTSGILPIPAVQGGAIENLIDYYIDYNNRMGLHDVTVFSVRPEGYPSYKQIGRTRYYYIDTNSFLARVRRRLRARFLPAGYYNYFINYFYHRCRRILLREEWDLILLENRPGYAIDLRQHTKARILVHQHLDNFNTSTYLANEICQSLNGVIGVSDYICSRVRAIGTQLPIATVHNGIDVQQFNNAEPAKRSDFGLKDDDFVMIYTGRVSPIKGISELVHAMNSLHHLDRLRLLVVGSSFYGNKDGGDIEFYKELQKEASQLRNRIIFTGFQPYHRMPSLLKMADVAVLPSTCQEAFAMTVVEAMAAGVPVLTTRSGGIPETCTGVARIIDQGPGLSERLRMNIEDLYLHPAERQQMASRGIERSQRFSKEQYAARLMATLEKME